MNTLIQKIESTHVLNKEELITLLRDNSINEELFAAADRVRQKYVGDEVHLRALIEFSNYCKRDCLYCGLRSHNKNVQRYRLTEDQILEMAEGAKSLGYKTLVLQSGEDDYFTLERMTSIISKLKKLDMAITLSMGEKSFEEYEAYKRAGADRYLIRIETTDKKLYEDMDPKMSHENRKECLKHLRALGYEVGTGSLVGLPNQSLHSIAEDLLFFLEIDADMIGIGPFIPNEDTPLSEASPGDFTLSLKVLALTRLLLPYCNLPATTAMETLAPGGRMKALQCGGNVVMPNVTIQEFKELYTLYPGKASLKDDPEHSYTAVSAKLASIGRRVALHQGMSKNYARRNE